MEDYPHSGSYTITAYELGSNNAVSSSTFKTGERIFVRIYNLNKNKIISLVSHITVLIP
ncbi:hypothetical protein D3C76_1512190 [compost metagenome]